MPTTSHQHGPGRSRNRQLTRRGVLWVGLRCDVRCKFCYDEHLATRDKVWITLEEATQALEKFRYYYHNAFVDFMGGEPTLHPRMVEIVGHAARIGLRPTVITHGMHLANADRAQAYASAGICDFLVSIHGIGDTAASIHGRGMDNFGRQMRALDNLRALGIPFRFNVTMIRDNLTQLEAIAELAGDKGARVVNFLTFNPYFEWAGSPEIDFQARHSEIAPYLARAIDKCTRLGIEANVRYMPPCQLPGLLSAGRRAAAATPQLRAGPCLRALLCPCHLRRLSLPIRRTVGRRRGGALRRRASHRPPPLHQPPGKGRLRPARRGHTSHGR